MNFNKKAINFFKKIKSKLNDEEQIELQKIIDYADKTRENNINMINEKRKDPIGRQITRINNQISYHNKRGNTDRVAELVMEREQLYKERDKNIDNK